MEQPAENMQPVSSGAGVCTPAALATQMGGDAAPVSSHPPLPLTASGQAVSTSRLRAVILYPKTPESSSFHRKQYEGGSDPIHQTAPPSPHLQGSPVCS